MSLHQTFNKTTKAELQKKLGKKNVHEVPVVQKVVVAMGIGSLASRKGVKEFTDLEQNMEAITGQKAQMILSKKDISNFKQVAKKIREVYSSTMKGDGSVGEELNFVFTIRDGNYVVQDFNHTGDIKQSLKDVVLTKI